MPEGEGEVYAFDFAEPALGFGSDSAGQEVGFDLVESGKHLRIDVYHGASETGLTELPEDDHAKSRVTGCGGNS